MIILMLFFLPLLAGTAAEYLICRQARKKAWRALLPGMGFLAGAGIGWGRYVSWDRAGGGAPAETLLLVPGVPCAGLFLGLWLGWKLWQKLWGPRVIQDKRGR